MKTYFLFVCKTSGGSVYLSPGVYDASQLSDFLEHLSSVGSIVIDVKVVCIDFSVYEH